MTVRHGLNAALLDIAYPFHIGFDRELRIVQVGPSMRRLIGETTHGATITELFEVISPKLMVSFDSLASSTRSLFVIRSLAQNDLTIRGQMLYDELDDVILFVGSPWVTSTAAFRALGLTLSDFAASDPVVDYVLLLQNQAASLTESQGMARQLLHQAYHDPLTGLPNRSLIEDHLSRLLKAGWSNDKRIAVLMLDLNEFKAVNDGYGHSAGDHVLVTIADRLCSFAEQDDIVGRFGGDEFTIVFNSPNGTIEASRDAAGQLADRISAAICAPIPIPSCEIVAQLSASIGIAIADQHDSAEDVIRNADLAMYEAKHQQRGRYEHYSPSMHAATVRRLHLAAELREGLRRDEFRLVYQPILTLAEGRFAGAEALLRWQHPTKGLLTPDQFLDIAETTGLIVPIGAWVMQQACQELRRWQGAHVGPEPLGIAVNLSARQLDSDIAGMVKDAIELHHLDPATLTLEITEGLIATERSDAHATIKALKDLGVWLAIDDFGTGHSSLSRLRDYEFDELKIDRRFVSDIDKGDTTLVATQIAMGHGLGLTIVAEGVETATQLEYLRTVGCQKVQGFLIARPLPPAAIRSLLAGRAQWSQPTPSPTSLLRHAMS